MKVEQEIMTQLARGPLSLQEMVRYSGYSTSSVYKAANDLQRAGFLIKFKEGKEVVASLSRSPEARRLSRLYVAAIAHGVDPEVLVRESVVDIWRWVGINPSATVRECAEVTGLSYETVRNAFHSLMNAGLAKAHSQRPLRISLEEGDLNRHMGRCFLNPPHQTVFTLSTAPFVKLYAKPDQLEDLLLSEEEPLVIEGLERNIRPEGRVKIGVVMEEDATPERVFLKELQTVDGVEDLCIQLLKGHGMDYEQLLRLSRDRGLVNVAGCYLDILSDLGPGLVRKDDAERFLPFVTGGRAPVFLRSEEPFGKEGWEGPYEARWNVNLFLDLGAIEHGIRAVS